jgi:hypothetical protein
MADFSNVGVALSADGRTLTLSGKALVGKSQSVSVVSTIQAEDGSTEDITSTGTRTVMSPGSTIIKGSVESGQTWKVAADGQSATLQ